MKNKRTKYAGLIAILILILTLSLFSCGPKFSFEASVKNWDKTTEKSAVEKTSGSFSIDLGKGEVDSEIPFSTKVERSYKEDKGYFKINFKIGEIRKARILNIILANIPTQISAEEINKNISNPEQYFPYNIDMTGFKFEHIQNLGIDAEIESLTRLAQNDSEIVLKIKELKFSVSPEIDRNIKFKKGTEEELSFTEFAEQELSAFKDKEYTWGEIKNQKLETLISYLTKMTGYDLTKLSKKNAKTLINSKEVKVSDETEIKEVSGESEILELSKVVLKLPGLQQVLFAVKSKLGLKNETIDSLNKKMSQYIKPGIIHITNIDFKGDKEENMKLEKFSSSQSVGGVIEGNKAKTFINNQINNSADIDQNTKTLINNIMNQNIGETIKISLGGSVETQYEY